MFLIVGLGNPGKEYDGTRHNIGFAAIDYIADKYNIELNRIKFKGVFGEGFINGKKCVVSIKICEKSITVLTLLMLIN